MVSVILPLYNAIRSVEPLFEQLARQTIPMELIVIDSSSTDGTPAWLQQQGIAFHSIPQAEFNHGGTRNAGVSMASAEYVIMLTQDALPAHRDSLRRLVAMLSEHPDMGLAYGRQLPYPQASLLSRFARMTNYPAQSEVKTQADIDRLGIRTCHCSNSFAAYRKSALLAVGGFPTNVVLGEDVVVAARLILAGQPVGYCAEAEVIHSHNYTIREEFGRYFDIGAFHAQCATLLHPFRRAETAGFRYVQDEWQFLKQQHRLDLIPEQVLRTVAKYAGYRLGQVETRLPVRLKARLSMHRSYWTDSTGVMPAELDH